MRRGVSASIACETCADSDCHGHGTASGTNAASDGDDGCHCECDEGWTGDWCSQMELVFFPGLALNIVQCSDNKWE